MALVRPITVDGTEYPTAYSRITTIRADKADAYVYVCTYADEAAANAAAASSAPTGKGRRRTRRRVFKNPKTLKKRIR